MAVRSGVLLPLTGPRIVSQRHHDRGPSLLSESRVWGGWSSPSRAALATATRSTSGGRGWPLPRRRRPRIPASVFEARHGYPPPAKLDELFIYSTHRELGPDGHRPLHDPTGNSLLAMLD